MPMILILTVLGFLVVAQYFFGRRVGGGGGGAERNIVGVMWLTAAIALGAFATYHR